MTALKELIENIYPADAAAAEAAKKHWDSLAKPLGSLGALENALTQIAALTG